jgi:hypothetical protein
MSNLTLYLGDVAQVTGNNMNIIAGTKLNIVEAPTADQNAANKAYVDLKAKQVQDALNLVTAGAGADFDTLLELKTISDNVRSSGLSDLSSETSSRVAADASLTTRVSQEESNARAAELSLTSRVSQEESNARAAELSLTSRVSQEESNARAAELSLTTRLSTEEVARDAADDRLETLTLRSSTTMMYVPAVYADSSTLPIPLERCNYAATTNAGNFDGWRMRNSVAEKKFNFYVPATGLKVSDVKAMYLETCTPSVVSMPFLTIYTVPFRLKDANGNIRLDDKGKPLNDPTNAATWYRSRATYIRNDSDVLVAGSKYNMVANVKNISHVHSSNYLQQHNMILDTYSSAGVDKMVDNDDILAFAISSDSSAAVGNVECIIGKFKIQLSSGIHEFVFSNQHVFTDYMRQKNAQLWNTLYGTSASDDPFMLDYQIPRPARFPLPTPSSA